MEFLPTKLEGVYLIQPIVFEDERGQFIKTFHQPEFEKVGLNPIWRESFISNSKKDVIRGMHFQIPPYQHEKLVYCTSGKVLDVLLDIRLNSKTYGQYQSFELSSKNHHQLFIPIGIAHGFLSLQDNSTLIYLTTKENHKDFDLGIRYDTFGFEWGIKTPIISKRDENHPRLEDFKSMF